jgi:hypothetical protein
MANVLKIIINDPEVSEKRRNHFIVTNLRNVITITTV